MRNSLARLTAFTLLLMIGGAVAMAQDIEVKDPRFDQLVSPDAKVEKLAGDMRFIEGPVWFDDDQGGHLIFSDIPSNRMHKWTRDGGLSVFREPSNNTNGNTKDLQGRLISCEHGSRQVTRTEPDGSITVLAREYQGKRLNSPNDAVVKSDGSIWFTDPPYGLKGEKEAKELDKQYVFRLDPETRELTVVADDFVRPNGLAFSPDEKRLYIADSAGRYTGQETAWVRVFDVTDDGTLSNGRQFCKIDKGVPDGMRVDEQGNLWTTAGDGVRVFAPDGTHLGTVLCPETPANCAFGGPDGTTLFMTAHNGLYAVETNTRDARSARAE